MNAKTRAMRLFTRRWRSIVRIMVDHHMDAWLHRGTVICMCAQLMSGPGTGPSSLVRLDFEEETIARPRLLRKRKNGERAADERDGHEEWPAGSPESAARCNTCATRAHARASILQLLTLMPLRPLGRTREQVTQQRLARIVRRPRGLISYVLTRCIA